MKKFRGLSSKEKTEFITINILCPLVLLFSWFGKLLKPFVKRKQQIVACALSLVMIISILPISTMAAAMGPRPGDVNSDGNVDVKDVLTFKRYLAGHELTFDKIAADVNVDGNVELSDLLLIKKYLAGWDINLGEGMCVISFDTKGGTPVETVAVKVGEKIAQTPTTSKEGFTFLHWETEDGEQFYAEDEIISSMKLVAVFEEMPVNETLKLTTFTQLDQKPDLSFTISVPEGMTEEKIKQSLVLNVIDGSDPVELSVTRNADGTYKVFATEGFNEGCSYTLVLPEGMAFSGKEESIRNASFTIYQKEVANLGFNEDLKYIKDTDEMTYKLDTGETQDMLDFATISSKTNDDIEGTFEYTGELTPGEIICIYEKVDPRERDMTNEEKYKDDSIVFIEITAKTGNLVSFKNLDDEDSTEVLFMPDTLPFKVESVPTGLTGKVESATYDMTAWAAMGKTKAPEFDIGDFVVFYTGEFADLKDDSKIYFGEVTAISGSMLTYKKTTSDAIKESMDVFTNSEIPGDEILEQVDQAALKEQISKQMVESGFANNAAKYLAQAALETDVVKNSPALKSSTLTKVDGTPLSEKERRAIGAEIEISDGVKVNIEIGSGSKYFNEGIRVAVGIEAEFSVDLEGVEMKILLKASFVEEIAFNVNTKGNGHVTWYVIVPVIDELGLTTNIDVKNYTAISLKANIYTVPGDDFQIAGGDWDEFSDLKETFDKIDELKEKIEQAKDTIDKINGYKDDLKKLLDTINSEDELNYKKLAEAFGEMNITNDLKELLSITDGEQVDAGVRDLMQQYCELLEQECGWTEVVRQNIFSRELYIYGIIAVEIRLDFIISAKVNISLGVNMEYVVGKRYSFWFDIISKNAGSSQMDLLDERFAFQFYVMGTLGMRMGLELGVNVGLFTTQAASVGVTAEFGPYVEIYGYFIYEYTQMRPANTSSWEYDQKMMGALYLEFGLYIEVTFKAQAFNNNIKYEPTLFERQYPLLDAGTRRNVYSFGYEIKEDEKLRIVDEDSDSSNGYTMDLPESYRSMTYLDLQRGLIGKDVYNLNKFYYSLSNRNFSIDERTGKITVNVPDGVSYMESDLTLTWKTDKLAFRSTDLKTTIRLVWTNLSTDELKEAFTATVKVGNQVDGYTTVWSNRVIKNEQFNLPTKEEVLELLNYDSYNVPGLGNLLYSKVTGYTTKELTDVKINRDTTYYFEATPREYILNITGVQNADGSTKNMQFKSKYGEKFDLSSLAETGSNSDKLRKYTAFYNTETVKGGEATKRNLNDPINRSFATELLSNSAVYKANYVDNSITVTLNFVGADIEKQTQVIKKGTVPADTYTNMLIQQGKMVKKVDPAIVPTNASTTYTIYCETTNVPKHTITYNTNGGSAITPSVHFEGAVINAPTSPSRDGYNFVGWYSDSALKTPFTFTIMPTSDVTVYAKWAGKQYTVSFNPGEGTLEGNKNKEVTFGSAYGTLPTPIRNGGFVFVGWFTDPVGGTQVKADTVYNTLGAQTIYAHWNEKATIKRTDITINPQETTYNQKVQHATYTHKSLKGFKIQYKMQNTDKWEDTAVSAGMYDVRIQRAEDEAYKSFDETYTGILRIKKATRTVDVPKTVYKASYDNFRLNLEVPDNRGELYFEIGAVDYQEAVGLLAESRKSSAKANEYICDGLEVGRQYRIFAGVRNDPNYEDCNSRADLKAANYLDLKTKPAPRENGAMSLIFLGTKRAKPEKFILTLLKSLPVLHN